MKHCQRLVIAIALWISSAAAHAASQTWTAGVDATWDLTTANWSGALWVAGNDALFNGAGLGQVNLATAGVTANSVTFNAAGYTLAGGPLALTGTAAITTAANATIGSVMTGNLTKLGAGVLTVTGTNTGLNAVTVGSGVLYATGSLYDPNNFVGGLVTVNTGGTLRLTGWGYSNVGLGSLANSTNTLVVNGGTIAMAGSNSASWWSRDFTVGAGGATLLVDAGITWNVGGGVGGFPSNGAVANNSSLTLDGAGTGMIYGPVSGSGNLTKSGAGNWTLYGALTYSGTTTVNAGILTVNQPTFADDRALTIASGATLNLPNIGTDIVGSLVIGGVTKPNGVYGSSNSGGAITGAGMIQVGAVVTALTWNGATNFSWDTSSANWSGVPQTWQNGDNAIFDGTGIGTVNISTSVTAESVTFNTAGYTIAGGTLGLTGGSTITTNANATISSVLAGSLTKNGTGTLTLAGTSDLGNLTVTSGVLDVTGNLYNNWTGGAVVSVNTGGSLRLYGWGYAAGGLGSMGGQLVVNGGTLEMAGSNSLNWLSRGFSIGSAGATLLVDAGITWNFGNGWPDSNPLTNNSSLVLDGPGSGIMYKAVTGTGSLTKTGAGTWTLSGSNSYSGATTISQGTLIATGAIGGPVTVNGTLMLGSGTGIGTLMVANTMNLAGNVTLRLGGGGACDTVTGLSSIHYGGALVVNNPGNAALANGTTFTLFAAGSYSGTFASITLPPLTSGLTWDTSSLAVNGSIRVRTQTLTTLSVTPAMASVAPGGTQQFTVNALDQLGVPMGVLPSFTWSCSGAGSVSGAGLFTAPLGAGSSVITVASGGLQASATATVAGALPMTWAAADTGTVGLGGGTIYNGSVYTVTGAGGDIGGTADGFQFSSKYLTGDGEIRARITSQTNTNAAAKAGVMLRSGSGAGAINALMALTPGGFSFQYRSAVGGTTTAASATANAAPNNWVRLVRSGTLVTGYVSANGTTWSQIGTQSMALADTLSVGLAVTSHNLAAVSAATFDNVTVTPFPKPWQTMDIGNTVKLGSAEAFNGVYTLKGAGTLSGGSDKFRYLYQTASGTSSEIIARISTLQNTSTNNARLGVMIRSGTTATAPYAFVGVTGGRSYKFQTRTTDGGGTTPAGTGTGTIPIWLKLVRSGDAFTGYRSADGATWTAVGTATFTGMGSTTYIGLVDASGNTTGLNTSVFDNVSGSSITSTAATEASLTSFEDAAPIAQMWGASSRSQSTDHVTDGSHSLRVDFLNWSYPSVIIPASQFSTADWSAAGALMFDAYNADSVASRGILRFRDTAGNSWDVGLTLPPGLQQRVAIGLHLPNDIVMNGYPLAQSLNADLFGKIRYGTNPISTIEYFLDNPGRAQTVYLDHFYLADMPPLVGIVDRYGQSTVSTWPGKVTADADLTTGHTTEAADLAARLAALPASSDRDIYGGWSAGPTLTATGWFRTQKLNGKWWLVTPSGHLFWSTGVTGVGASCANIPGGDGNLKLYSWLPVAPDPLADYAWWWGADFYQMNLYRTFGAGWPTNWQTTTRDRLTAWGFNTLGAWSDSNSFTPLQKPFTVALGDGTADAINGGQSDYYGSAWAATEAANLDAGTQPYRDNPLCLGYFVGNEMGWTGPDGVPVDALNLPGTRAVKAAFTAILQTKYGAIANLNAAWGISAPAWTDWADFLANPVVLPSNRNAALEADLSMLYLAYANQYYSVVNSLMKQYAPNQLYLGSRFGGPPPDEVAIAAGNHCDVVTYNVYGTRDALLSRGQQIVKFDKPAMIGEFHFGATDRGMFAGGMVTVASQQARGANYADYVNTALAQPWCVGAHWFQYVDQPLLGRGDGENYNIGLVSVADASYQELVSQAAAVNWDMYNIRNAAAGATPATIVPSGVTGNSANLGVTGGNLGGGPDVKYTWTVTGTAPGSVTFSPNGTHAASQTTASFTQPGNYQFRVTITDALGNVITSDLSVSTLDWTRSAITLNSAVTASGLQFGDASPSPQWTVTTGSGGPLTLSDSGAAPVITVNNQPVTMAVVLTGSQGLLKNGAGTLVLSGNNTYTGDTNLNSGVLDTGASGRLYASAPNLTAVTTVLAGGTLRVAGWGANTAGLGQLDCGADRLVVNGGTIEWAGATARSGSRAFTIGAAGATLKATGQGTWTLAHSGNPAYDALSNNYSLALDGAGAAVLAMDISGSGGLTKKGAGTWSVTGSNNYSGATTVESGTLTLTQPNLANSSTLTIGLVAAAPAILNLPNAGTDQVGALVIDGVSQPDGLYDASNTGGAITGAGKIQVGATILTPYQSWAESISGFTDTDPAHDPDGDGLTNQQEFAFGLDPMSGVSADPIKQPLDKATGTFTYTRRDPALSGLVYQVNTSTDLTDWKVDANATQTVIGTTNNIQTVRVTLSGPQPLTAVKIFVRVTAE
jgi:autotransporter-associated beta strand protein